MSIHDNAFLRNKQELTLLRLLALIQAVYGMYWIYGTVLVVSAILSNLTTLTTVSTNALIGFMLIGLVTFGQVILSLPLSVGLWRGRFGQQE